MTEWIYYRGLLTASGMYFSCERVIAELIQVTC